MVWGGLRLCFTLWGPGIKSCLDFTSASVWCHSFNLSPTVCFLLDQLVPLSGVSVERSDRKEAGHGNREQKQRRKRGRARELLSRLQREAGRHEAEY